jgi:chromosome partitioning protein
MRNNEKKGIPKGQAMVISVAAQKGGVGKTSIALHLSGVAAEKGIKVLLVDVDPQGSLSSTFIQDVYSLERTVKDVLLDPDLPASKAIQKTKFENIDVLPSSLALGQAELDLLSDKESIHLLADKLEEVKQGYGLILIDCQPSLGIFPRIALTASDYVLIPLECSSFAVKTTGFLLDMIGSIRKKANPGLEILGFVLNRVDMRRRIEQDYGRLIREQFGNKVLKTELKNSSRYLEAASLKVPVSLRYPKSEQAETYRNLFKELFDERRADPHTS